MRLWPPGGTALTWWFTAFAGYAAIIVVVAQGPSRTWGLWAVAGYALAALTAWRSPGPVLPLLIGVCVAAVVPTIWLATSWQPGGEPTVVARAALLLLHHGSPYLPSGQLVSAMSYNPYLPAMSVFGFPHLAGLPGVLGNPTSWMALATLVLTAAAIGVGTQDPDWRSAPAVSRLLRNTALAVASPMLALPVALGTTDSPVIALMCLSLACASRSGEGHRGPRGTASRWVTWNALAALAIGIACAMKAIAWPALPVIAAMIAAREGLRTAARFTGAAIAVTLILIAAFAPALLTQPGAFVDNIIAYPLGFARHLTTAASPLPGHLLADTGTLGRIAAVAALLAAAAAIASSLVLRPPRDTKAAAVILALGLVALFTLAPDARFGYFAYPLAIIGWLLLTGHGTSPAGTAAAPPVALPRQKTAIG